MHQKENTPKLALIAHNREEKRAAHTARGVLELRSICRLGSEAVCDGLYIAHNAAHDCYAFVGESISIRDFMRAHGYASLHTLAGSNFTRENTELVFVSKRYPRMLMRYLVRNRHYTIKHSTLGVYSIEGDLFPIRVIVDEQRVCG
jgi:hypothetical protein